MSAARIEAAAKALYLAMLRDCERTPWLDAPVDTRDRYRDLARAALVAADETGEL